MAMDSYKQYKVIRDKSPRWVVAIVTWPKTLLRTTQTSKQGSVGAKDGPGSI